MRTIPGPKPHWDFQDQDIDFKMVFGYDFYQSWEEHSLGEHWEWGNQCSISLLELLVSVNNYLY